MKWIALYCFWSVTCFTCAQTLPGFKNGSWWIISNGKANKLPASISYLGNFDEFGTAEFIENNRYGIIRSDENIVLAPTLFSISAIGKGLFECVDSLRTFIFDVKTNEITFQNVTEIITLNSAYSIIHQDTTASILFLENRTVFPYSDTIAVLSSNWNTVFLKENDSLHVFFTPNGQKHVIPSKNVELFTDKLIYTIDNLTTLITARFTRSFSQNPQLNILPNYISFYENGKAHLLNMETGNVEISAPFEQISPTNFGGYYVRTNGKTGWVNNSGVLKIPVKYDNIYQSGDNYVVVNAELNGFYNKDFKLVLPATFYSYTIKGNFVFTTSILGYQGLYSMIQNKSILEDKYSIIYVNNSIVKAYYGKNIRVLGLSERHTIQSDIILENAITVKQANFSPYDPNYRYDKRLLSLGWFFSEMESNSKQKYVWGLKNEQDSVILPPRFKAPVFIPNRSFSLIKERDESNSYPANYSMRNFSNGKKINNLVVIGIDTVDCSFRSYARMYTSDGYKILLPDNTVKSVKYIGCNYGKFVPYCIAENVEYSNKATEEFVAINQYLSNGFFRNTNINWYRRKIKYDYQKFTDGKWNYLDSLGNDLFAESFQFAEEFFLNRAIVKKNDKWGVISKDSVMIPFLFSEVKRIPNLGDSIFLVKKNSSGMILLDETTKNLGANFSIVKSKGALTVISKNNKNEIYRNNQLENTTSSNFILLGYNEYTFREKKEYRIFDAGNEVGTSIFKPKKVIGQLLLIEDKSKLGLAYLNGETLFSPDKYTFEAIGIFILKKGKYSNEVLSNEGNKIIQFSDEQQIFIDPITNTIALIKNNKIQLFDQNGNLVETIKSKFTDHISDYYAGCFFSPSHIQSTSKTLLLSKDISYKLFENGYFAVFSIDNQVDMYKNGLEKVFSCTTKRITEIGNGIFAYQTREGLIIRNDNHEKHFPILTTVEQKFSDGFCLLRANKVVFYIDTLFENPFYRTFLDATSFKNGNTTVKLASGWTILNKSGDLMSYPSFDKINQLGYGLFETPKKAIYGVIDGNGQEIVPCQYEKVEVLSMGIIKVIKQGEIGYFNLNGEPVFEIGK